MDHTPSQAELREIARHISDTERTSAEAESETKQIKLLEYLHRMASSDEPPIFDGLITDVRPMGLMVEIPAMGLRGVVKREELPEGRWRLEAHRKAWVSFDGEIIQLGMRIPLRVIDIDFDRRFVDFTVVGKATGEGAKSLLNTPAPAFKQDKHPKNGVRKKEKDKQPSRREPSSRESERPSPPAASRSTEPFSRYSSPGRPSSSRSPFPTEKPRKFKRKKK